VKSAELTSVQSRRGPVQ